MKKITVVFFLFVFFCQFDIKSQVDLSNFVNPVIIHFNDFTGAGFSPSPTTGQLSSHDWSILGMSDGVLNFGETQTTGDFVRGMSSGGVSTGGIYAFDNGTTGTMLGVQPITSDFNPGHFILRLQNNTGKVIVSLDISYVIWTYNDQGRSSSFNFSHSADNSNYTSESILDFTSPTTADANPQWESSPRSILLQNVNIADGDFYYLRWSGADVGGSGSRDEFGLDDVSVLPIGGLNSTFTASDICLGDSVYFNSTVSGGVSPYSYSWDFGDAQGSSSAANPYYSYSTSGSYTVELTVTDSDNNTTTSTQTVEVYDLPIVLFSVDSLSGCAPLTVQFTDQSTSGEAITDWAWDFATGNNSTQTNPSETFGAGTYQVKLEVVDANGCVNIDSISILVNPVDVVSIIQNDTTICIDSLYLQATPIDGLWSGSGVNDQGSGEAYFYQASPGTYTATYTSGGNCPGIEEVEVTVVDNPVAGFTYTINGSVLELVSTSQNTNTVVWSITQNGVTQYSNLLPTSWYPFTSLNDIEVCIEARGQGNCPDEYCEIITGLRTEEYMSRIFVLYPNPAYDQLNIARVDAAETVWGSVSNIAGQEAMRFVINPGVTNMVLDISPLSAGTYLIQFTSGEKRQVSRFNKTSP